MPVKVVSWLLATVLLLGCSGCALWGGEKKDSRTRSVGLPTWWLINEHVHGRVVDADSCAQALASSSTRPDLRLCTPVVGARVELNVNSGTVVEETTTDEHGRFFFPRTTRRQILTYADKKNNAYPGGELRISAKDYWMIDLPVDWSSGQTAPLARRTETTSLNPSNVHKRHIAVIVGSHPF